ncbi:hypothetical protein [Pseudomonas alcaligenes]|uniref:hypothetical protein n=1 Tax=Aquipseudomonas alcaligenes TaxID=43263 RepID=UPI00358F7FB2
MNRWSIPPWLEEAVLERDQACIYCAVPFSTPANRRGDRPSWEHIINDMNIVTLQNIARCCLSCNASKGAKHLRSWLQSPYCLRKNISESTVAPIARQALLNGSAIQ